MTASADRPARVEDVHRIARALPHVPVHEETADNPVHQVGGKCFVFFRGPAPDAADPEIGA